MKTKFRPARLAAVVGTAVFVCALPAVADDCPELVGRWPYGPTKAVATSGDHVYFGSGATLYVAEITDSSIPSVVGEVALSNAVEDVAVSGNYAYIANNKDGIRIIDISSASSPVEVGFAGTDGEAYRVAVAGNHVFAVNWCGVLSVIDVSVATDPTVSSAIDVGCARGVAASGDYAYVAVPRDGMRVIDVSTPSMPEVMNPSDDELHGIDVAVSGNHAYLASYGGLRVVDISSPSQPSVIGAVSARSVGHPRVAVAGDIVYIAARDNGLPVIDVSQPTNPVVIGHHDTPGDAIAVSIFAGSAYVSDSWAGLRVIDVAIPNDPREVGHIETPGLQNGVVVSGDYAFLAETNGLRIIRIPERRIISSSKEGGFILPLHPVEVGFVRLVGVANDVAVSGDNAFVANGSAGLRVIDVAAPGRAAEVGSINTPGYADDVAVSGDYAYVADGPTGLRVIDVSSVSNPVEVAYFNSTREPTETARVVTIDGRHAYVGMHHPTGPWGAESGFLSVVDISDPENPHEVGFLGPTLGITEIAISGEYAFVTSKGQRITTKMARLETVNIVAPSSPTKVGEVYIGHYNFHGVAISGDFANVAWDGISSEGLAVFDASVPQKLVEMGYSSSYRSGCRNVASSNRLVYLTTNWTGLEIYDISKCPYARTPRRPGGRRTP